jgi:hypothetical protein
LKNLFLGFSFCPILNAYSIKERHGRDGIAFGKKAFKGGKKQYGKSNKLSGETFNSDTEIA